MLRRLLRGIIFTIICLFLVVIFSYAAVYFEKQGRVAEILIKKGYNIKIDSKMIAKSGLRMAARGDYRRASELFIDASRVAEIDDEDMRELYSCYYHLSNPLWLDPVFKGGRQNFYKAFEVCGRWRNDNFVRQIYAEINKRY